MGKENNSIQSQKLVDLYASVKGLNLSEQEIKFLEWLSGWEMDSVYSFISLINKARKEV